MSSVLAAITWQDVVALLIVAAFIMSVAWLIKRGR